MYVFGTQYLRGATPARDQWDRDMENMAGMGFNTIRAWLVWTACEKAEGEIDHEYITGFLDCAKKHGLDVGLLFHLHAAPDWAMDALAVMHEQGLSLGAEEPLTRGQCAKLLYAVSRLAITAPGMAMIRNNQ